MCACACERGGGGRSAGRRRVGRSVGPAVGRREQPQKVRTPHNDVGKYMRQVVATGLPE